MNENEVKLIITTDTSGAIKGVEAVGQKMGSLSSVSESVMATVRNHWLGFTAAVYSVIKVFREFEEAAQRQEKRLAFDNLASSVNRNAANIVAGMREASGGLLSLQKTIEITGQSMLLGLSPVTVQKLTEVARASARVTGQTMQQAMGDITLGVARQSKMILDNLGIMVDYDAHLKRLQTTLGKTEAQLTDADRRQAFLNATFEAGDAIIARVGGSVETLSERIGRLKATLADTVDTVKDYITGIAFIDAAAAASKFGALTEQYGKQRVELEKLLKSYGPLKHSIQEMAAGREEPSVYKLKEFERVEAKVISIQKAMNSTTRMFGIGNVVAEFEKLEKKAQETRDAFERLADEALKGVDAKIKADAAAYQQLKVKTADWLRYNVNAAREEKDAFVNAGVDKLMAEQIFLEKRKALLDEFVKSRAGEIGQNGQFGEDEIRLQLRGVDYAEKGAGLGVNEAYRQRVDLYQRLLGYQQDYLAGVDKERDPAGWYTQRNAIEDTREALQRLTTDYDKLAQATREAEIQLRLSNVALAEQDYQMGKAEAVEERIRLYKELLSIQEDYLDTIDKLKDPTGWITQQREINNTREELQKLNLEGKRQTGSFGEGMGEGFRRYVHDAKTTFELGEQMATEAARAMTASFSDFFFDAMTGKLKSLGSYIKSFLTSILRALSDVYAQIAVKGLMTGLFPQGAFGNTAVRGESGVNAIFGHTGGYLESATKITRYHDGAAVGRNGLDIFNLAGLKRDEVPIVAKAGEFILNDRAVSAIGLDNLHWLNKLGGSGGSGGFNRYHLGGAVGSLGSNTRRGQEQPHGQGGGDTVVNINVENKTGLPLSFKQTGLFTDERTRVKTIILDLFYTDPGFKNAMKA